MEPTIKDKYIILGFIGVAICLISFFITLIVSARDRKSTRLNSSHTS